MAVSRPLSASLRYQAILWDNDGVLVDTERWYHEATRGVLAQVGVDLTHKLFFEHFLVSAGGVWALLAARGLSEAAISELRHERNAAYEKYLAEQPIAIEGVEEVLRALRPHFAMGIVTSSRRGHFEAIHRRTGFLKYFDFALTLEDYENAKPDPEPYLLGAARCGYRPEQCVAIEDAPRGVIAARAAGMDCWAIPTALTRRADFSNASRVLRHIGEVADTLLATPTPEAPPAVPV